MVNNQSTFNPERNLAMLIDADNAQYSLLKEMIEETSRYGTITLRRAYGDFTTQNLAKWREPMLNHAIRPVQQWRFTTGKNATDGAMIIDAMDILAAGNVQGFCIVSSDSDFTSLCTRIRESGLFVMGIGRRQTPNSFIQACDVFVIVENLVQDVEDIEDIQSSNITPPIEIETTTTQPEDPRTEDQKLYDLFRSAFEVSSDDSGWAQLGTFGSTLKRLDPSFDSRTYGYKRLSLLIKAASDLFEIKGENNEGSSSIYVRMKDS